MSPLPHGQRPKGLLDNLQLVVTIIVAVLGAWVSYKQFRITGVLDTERQKLEQRMAITQQSAELVENTRIYLNDLNLSTAKKNRVLLSLLKIEKDIRISQTGELSDDKIHNIVNALPYDVALLSGDSAAVAHIGGEADLAIWLPIAKTSGDIEVRKTAIEALKNIAAFAPDDEILKSRIVSIIELTRGWNVSDLSTQAAEAIAFIDRNYKGEKWQGDLSVFIKNVLSEYRGSVSETLVEPSRDDVSRNVVLARVSDQGNSTTLNDNENITVDRPQVNVARRLANSYEFAPSIDLQAEKVKELIEQFGSDDTKTRRLARSRIAAYGDGALPGLFDALAQSPNDYRIQVGVVAALSLMDPATPIADFNFAPLVDLLGNGDQTLRTNTAVYLGQLADEGSLEAARNSLEALSANPDKLDNTNLIHNSVIVLGDWLRYNRHVTGDLRQRIEASLRAIDDHLEADRGRSWTTTRSKIAGYLTIIPNEAKL